MEPHENHPSSPAQQSPPLDSIDPSSLLSSLRPPQPYSVHVQDLTIVAPIPQLVIPLAIPIPIPEFARRWSRKEREVVAKELVRGVSARVEPGEVLAIIGGSGSGKTTLLNTIACRLSNLEITSGAVSFIPSSSGPSHSSATSSKRLKNIIGFVRQDDFLLPYLTVRETLTFAAALRLPATVSKEIRGLIVEQTISELGLTMAADVIVGGPFRKGISGGEKRRLSIGCILVTLPSVLVLDEPTTGLDSFTAFQLLETLSRLAKRGRSVILSIHQPRSDAFPLFNKITLLSTGSVIFSGPSSALLPHFESLGYAPSAHTNPLDFVIDVSSLDTRSDAAERRTRESVGKLVVAWRAKELAGGKEMGVEEEGMGVGIERVTSKGSQLESRRPEARPGWAAQTALLTRRSLLNVFRNYGQNVGFLFQALIIGISLGLAFYKPPETPGGIQTLKTIVYQSTPAYFYLSIIVFVFIQTTELIVFDREREDNLYATIPYVLGSFLSYLPGNVVFPTIYALLIYFMCGFTTENLAINLLSFIAQCIMQQLAACSYALLACSINRSFASASLLANGFSIPFILSSGYLIPQLPIWIAWTRWISPYFYGFQWIARLQFVGRTFACEGVTGPALNACDGTAVLVGLRFPLETPLFVYPLGLLGFIIVTEALSTLLLQNYHPGGVKHAAQQSSSEKTIPVEGEKEKESEVVKGRERVDVLVEGLGLVVRRRSLLMRGAWIEKTILTEVDCSFPAGQVSVIMGPSGAGKSSLLQLLAGRLGTGASSDFRSTGSIFLSGQRFDSSMAALVAFVEQEDAHHLPALTVRETLRYAAALRMRGASSVEQSARAEEVLRMLGLKLCADNLVGGELLKGISGGEKRRLSLAVQLLSDPAVLFADEPLSGLDAFTAHNVMQTLKNIASSGRTVVVSVHQPRSDIWELFDNVLLLVKGGRTAYSGPREEILDVFERAQEVCPKDFNPADFILDCISVDYRSSDLEQSTEVRVARILAAWKNRAANSKADATHRAAIADVDRSRKILSAPFFTAFPVVLARSFKNLRRQQEVFVARLINPPFLALLFWLFFARLDLGPSSAQTRVGVLQETTAMPFVGMLACIAIFPTEKALFFHEWKSSGRQSVFTFLMAYTVQETSVSIVASLLFSLIIVFGIGLQSAPRIFIEFWFTIFCLLNVGESVGIIFSSFFNNGGLAVSLVSAGITILSQLNGIISVTLPRWLEIIGWASPMKAQSRIEIMNEFVGLRFNCTPQDISTGACIAATGEQLLETFSITPGPTGKYIVILMSLILIFRGLAFLALRIKVVSL